MNEHRQRNRTGDQDLDILRAETWKALDSREQQVVQEIREVFGPGVKLTHPWGEGVIPFRIRREW